MTTRIGFIGLGAMGFGMASHLIQQGYHVKGFDISQQILQKFTAIDGTPAISPADAVQDCDICVCMLATSQQAQTVLLDGQNPAAPALPPSTPLLICSTVSSGYIQQLSKDLANRGRADIALIDCPVSGGTVRAADGSLSIMAAAASSESLEKGRVILQALSDPAKLYIVQGGLGAGSNMKMVHQVMAANHILGSSEAMGFASHLGLDLTKTSNHIINSDASSWMFANRLPRILDPTEPLSSAITIILKDAGIITSEARRAGFACNMTSTAEQVFFTALGRGWGADDDGTLVRLYTEGMGKLGPARSAVEDEDAKIKLVVNLLRGIYLCAAAEALAFAHSVGLDLDQVYELCMQAAGGSQVLATFGQQMIQVLRNDKDADADGDHARLAQMLKDVEDVVDEAQRLKVPLFLGAQALNLLRRAHGGHPKTEVSASSVVRVWV